MSSRGQSMLDSAKSTEVKPLKLSNNRVYQRRTKDQLRNVEFKIRCTEEEYQRLAQLSMRCGKPLSVYCRETSLGVEQYDVKNVERWGNLGRLGKELVDTKRLIADGGNFSSKIETLIEELLTQIKGLRRDL